MQADHWEDDAYQGQIDFALWRRIARHARPYRRPLTGLAASGLIIAAVDVLFPIVTAHVIDEAITRGLTSRMYAFGAAYAALIGAFSFCVWWFIGLAGRVASGVAYDLRRGGFNRLQELSFSYFDVRPIGWLVSRLTSDCSKVSSLLPWFMLDLVWGSLTIVGIIAAMLWLDTRLGIVVTLSFFVGSDTIGFDALTSALGHAVANVVAAGPMIALVERVLARFSDEEVGRRATLPMGIQRRSIG